MITTIIFSKDRPLQLDLCLNSIKKNLVGSDDITITVIENYSEKYQDALKTLKSEHPEVNFIKQEDEFNARSSNLFKCVWTYLNTQPQDFPVAFFTDDGILFDKVNVGNIVEFIQNTNVAAYSMRMGTNINRREHEGFSFGDTLVKTNGASSRISCLDSLLWNKTVHCYGSYWSYSHSVDGHVFRYDDIFDWTDTLTALSYHKTTVKCKTPNDFESALQMFWPLSGSLMGSPQYSCYVNSPNNRVSSNFESNMSGEVYNYTSEFLLKKYMDGKRINLDRLFIPHIDCPHTEIDIIKGLK